MFNVGDRIQWTAVNGEVSGTIERILQEHNYFVRLDSGKVVIVNEKSAKKV